MIPFHPIYVARELRLTAQNLRLCLDELMAQDQSLLADFLRSFPKDIERLANQIAEPPMPDAPPAWPEAGAPAEVHFAVLLARQQWWQDFHAKRGEV